MSVCKKASIASGKVAVPRTCPTCEFGPCTDPQYRKSDLAEAKGVKEKTITLTIPKPGDKLPFVVAEWEGYCYKYHAGYNAMGNAFVEGKKRDYNGPYDIRLDGSSIWAIFALLGLPMAVKGAFAVAEVAE